MAIEIILTFPIIREAGREAGRDVKASGSFDSTCRAQIFCLNVPFPGAGRFKKIQAAGSNCRPTVFRECK